MKETLDGISIVRVPLYPDHSRSAVKRVLNYISFALSGSLLGPWLLDKPDVIFVYHPPLTIGIPAWILSRLWRVPFLYEIQDMWPETLRATGMLNNPRLLDVVGRFAKWVYAKADAISVISPGFRDNLIRKGISSEIIHLIPNWVDTTIYYPDEPDLQLANELGLADKFNIMFAGNIGEAQGLETVLEAAELLQDLAEVQFVIVGDGVALPRLREGVETRDLKNVRFLGRYPTESMPALYALADVLLVHLKDDPLFRITIPHKILSYMASGKPILAAIAGDAAEVVKDAGAGIICPPQNPAALAQTVQEFVALSAQARQRMGECGLRSTQEKFSRDNLVGKVESVLRDLVLGQRSVEESVHVSSGG
jgi:glycosyltransferase involved in cell wall biosynthesis